MSFWSDQNVVVTGGAGFLGSVVVEKLKKRGCKEIFVPRSIDYDLRDRDAVIRLYRKIRPRLVIHLAAVVGGIGANRANPGKFYYDNAIMGLELMDYARQFAVEKFVAVGTICAYPKFTPVPFKEENLWDGYPEETNAPYGLAKKMMLVQAQAYRAQWGFNAIYLLPVNLYGPRDNFDLETSHVIPAIIRKCVEAKQTGRDELVLWGDGSPTREFLYVEDAAEGLLLAAERYDGDQPVNLGSGKEIAIRDLAEIIAVETGFTGKIIWDTTKPNGQPRRCLDVSRAKELFGFEAAYSLRDGIRKTIDWFLRNRPSANSELRASPS
jgi:GDP-L-fucose synthase